MEDQEELDDLLKEFLVESYENLDQLDRFIVGLEEQGADPSIIGGIFRIIHTIKGTSGFFGLTKLEGLTHAGESLLSSLRDQTLQMTEEIASALLATFDGVRDILGHIEADGGEGDADFTELVATLERLNQAGAPKDASTPVASTVSSCDATDATPTQHEQSPVDAQSTRPSSTATPQRQPTPPPTADPKANDGQSTVADASIRVDVDILNDLMNLVGELVLARNQILQYTSRSQHEDAQFLRSSQRLNLVTSELQEGVMKTRMQPIGSVWNKLPRVVRDLARSCGKKIRIEQEGKNTELDRTIIEAIKDPLVHIVRNSCDHGIEMPDVRVAQGKNPEGRILLRAYHEGGQVNIEISDDGGGINAERVRNKAVSNGLLTNEEANRMEERELQNLIFRPGFSTAASVTNISGRGVGMDVVKSNIEKIGGSVDVMSGDKGGTTLKIKIPLTLAIIPGLIVTTRGDRYAIPQVSLLELVRLESKAAIEYIHGCPVSRLRGQLLPLVSLDEVLGFEEPVAPRDPLRNDDSRPNASAGTKDLLIPPEAIYEDQSLNIVVAQADGRPFGLIVDEILDTEEIVVKPLGKQLKSISAFAGATIMGDGRVSLILDVMGIAQSARVISQLRDTSLVGKVAGADSQSEAETLLVFCVGNHDARYAVPLRDVKRLEEIPLDRIEQSDIGDCVQYRGEIMPLIRLDGCISGATKTHAPDDSGADRDDIARVEQVIVFNEGQRSVGMVVRQIIDIVQENVTVRRKATRDAVTENVVTQGRVTEVLDFRRIIQKELPHFFDDDIVHPSQTTNRAEVVA